MCQQQFEIRAVGERVEAGHVALEQQRRVELAKVSKRYQAMQGFQHSTGHGHPGRSARGG